MTQEPTHFSGSEKQDYQPGSEEQMQQKPEYIKQDYRAAGKLRGKAALITGGDSGIGRAVSVHFAKEGADVAIVYLDESEDAEETKRLVEEAGQRCILIQGDVKDSAFCRQAVQQTAAELGKLNILVNNAAVQYPQKDVENITEEQLETTFRTNIFAHFYFAEEAMKYLKEGDCIINTTSVTAYRASPNLLDYSSTKGAILSFTRSLGKNLAEKNIRVNGVAPGPIWTPLIVSSFDEEKIEKFGQETPMKRGGQPSEVAPAYVFLASDDASYITGQVIHVNGGEVVNG
jgi:NAD(P)-dependent dehydrogenase (short-subunit alcohol dehydrogenase family)